MYIITDQVCKWRQRKHKKSIVSILSKFFVMAPLVVFATAGISLAAPSGGVITSGSGSITQVQDATNINQATQRLDINWQTFSTQVHESVNFFQPDSQSLAINRVIGGLPSELRGALNANGRVFVLNDAGITFYGTSQVNVGALIATTATDISEDGSRLSFSGKGYAQVLNQGTINVSDGGFAVLAAPYVANSGVIQANLGNILLASTNSFTMDFRGDGLIDFAVPKGVLDGVVSAGDKLGVDNSGALRAGSGTINITANLASDVIQSVVNLDGVVDASAFGPGTNGGTVLVTSVGDTNIGGTVNADGGLNGNGGSIYAWADQTNRFETAAQMTARGGEVSGNGGTMEVSGHDVLFRGTANASAPNGKAGTLIIDPVDLVIANGTGDGGVDGSTTFAGSPSGTTGTIASADTDPTTVYESEVESLSQAGTNVVLQATQSIKLADLTTDGVLQGGSGNISLTVTDGGSIWFENLNNKITTTTGSISMSALNGVETPGSINVGSLQTTGTGADITLTAGSGGITTGNLTTGGLGLGIANPGVISMIANNGGNIKVGDVSIIAEGNNTNSANAEFDANAAGGFEANSILVRATDHHYYGSAHANASATVTAGNESDITVDGNVTVEALANLNNTDSAAAHATFKATAGGDINLLGGLTVNAEASQIGSYGSGAVNAVATADLNAGNDIVITGDTKVLATALNDVHYASYAYAEAYLKETAGNDINVTGNILVKADATLNQGTNYEGYCYDGSSCRYASADAAADLSAGHDMTIKGDVSVLAKAVNNALSGSYADAYANLDMYTGGEIGGNINVTGNILVKADATLENGYSSAYASANADISADRDLTITGGVSVLANGLNNSVNGTDASASANLYLKAGNDLNATGNIMVESVATRNNGSEGADASAAGHLTLYAGRDMNVKGDVKVIADALLNQGSDVSANADIEARAENDLNITGDILIRSDATMGTGGTDNANAYANATISAGHNVTLLTDPITVLANAVSNYGNAYAAASLTIDAGQPDYGCYGECVQTGDLYITGDVAAIATAAVTSPSSSDGYFYTHSSEYASVRLSAPDSITNLYGTAPPKAYSPDPSDPAHALAQSSVAGYFDDYFGSYSDGAEGYAQLIIDAPSVTIEPKPTGPHDEEHKIVSTLESKDIVHIEPLDVGKDPLRIGADGLALWATGAGVTTPSEGLIVTQEAANEIEKGADPTKVLPATAAGGGMGLATGVDAYSVGGADYCDKVVSGYCLPESGGKKKK